MAILPAVDPVLETEPERGVILVQIFRAKRDAMTELTRRATSMFERFRAAGAREAAVYVSLDVPNNFPQLPFRTDGPYLVWMGVIPDDASVKARVVVEMDRVGRSLTEMPLLQAPPETIVLTPTPRSRLRWRSVSAGPGAN